MNLELGKIYSVTDLEKEYMWTKISIQDKQSGIKLSVWKKYDYRDSKPDDFIRFLLQPIGHYAYRLHEIRNINERKL
jgi:hypothetical protein